MLENWYISQAVEDSHFRYRLSKGVIIGAGNVGVACAVSLVIERTFNQLVLVDVNANKAESEAMDIMHGVSQVGPLNIKSGTLEKEGRDADVVIITAGVAQKPGETRLNLVERNTAIFKTFCKDIATYCPHAIVLVVTNPVDIMSYVTYKLTGFRRSRVIGSGTVLDTGRFKALLSEELSLDPRSINAYIVGEHGDSEFPLWSKMNIAGMPMMCEDPQTSEKIMEIYQKTKNAAYEIINRKGHTNWGIGFAVAKITNAIMNNEKRILPVSAYVDKMYGLPEVFVSLPAIVDRNGAEKVLSVELSELEQEKLQATGTMLRSIIDRLDI